MFVSVHTSHPEPKAKNLLFFRSAEQMKQILRRTAPQDGMIHCSPYPEPAW